MKRFDLTKSGLRFRGNEIVATLTRNCMVLASRRIRKENLEKYPTSADNLSFEAEQHSELLGIVMSVSFSPDGRVALIAVESDYVLDV